MNRSLARARVARRPHRRGWRGKVRTRRSSFTLAAAVCAAVAFGAPAGAQTGENLTGRVIDAERGNPIASVLIELTEAEGVRAGESGLQALTDRAGNFHIAGVPAGLHLIRVRHLSYGTHYQPLRIEGTGTAAVEIVLSRSAVRLAPLVVDAEAFREIAQRASPASRNILTREQIEPAASSGVHLGDFLRREISGIHVRQGSGVGGTVCVEFRGARRADGGCRPPQVYLDGATVPDPLPFFGYFDLSALARVQVIPPSEGGGSFGPNAGWGVIILETRRGTSPAGSGIPIAHRTPVFQPSFDWSLEDESHPWARVYASAFLGNALGLTAGMVLLDQCMDLSDRRFYRGQNHCGLAPLMAAGVAAAALPALGGSLAARFAGETERSRGLLRQSLLYSLPAFVPGYALASLNAGQTGLGGLEIAGVALVVFGAPILNTLADHRAREWR